MAPERLYVVARPQRALYEFLRRTVASERVGVVLDRRQAERRSARRAPPGPERRQLNRRRCDVGPLLEKVGWAMIDLREDRPHLVTLQPGHRVVLYRFNPLVGRNLVGRRGVVERVARVRAAVLFAGESKARMVDLADLIRIEEADAPGGPAGPLRREDARPPAAERLA